MELVNYTLLWVWEALDKVLKEKKEICSCEQCRYDMACLAVNNLKPNYVVNRQGGVYARTKMLSQQMPTDVLTEVVKAVDKVSKNPYHFRED